MEKRVYISGKIAGLDEQATRGRFKDYQEELKGKGYDVVNPFELCDEVKRKFNRDIIGWGEMMRIDLKALEECDAIFMLDGWTDSPGARIEHEFAISIGLLVIYEDLNGGSLCQNK